MKMKTKTWLSYVKEKKSKVQSENGMRLNAKMIVFIAIKAQNQRYYGRKINDGLHGFLRKKGDGKNSLWLKAN